MRGKAVPVICRGTATKKGPQEFKFSLGDFMLGTESSSQGFLHLSTNPTCFPFISFLFNLSGIPPPQSWPELMPASCPGAETCAWVGIASRTRQPLQPELTRTRTRTRVWPALPGRMTGPLTVDAMAREMQRTGGHWLHSTSQALPVAQTCLQCPWSQ